MKFAIQETRQQESYIISGKKVMTNYTVNKAVKVQMF